MVDTCHYLWRSGPGGADIFRWRVRWKNLRDGWRSKGQSSTDTRASASLHQAPANSTVCPSIRNLVKFTRITQFAFNSSHSTIPSRALKTAVVGDERYKATKGTYWCRPWQLRCPNLGFMYVGWPPFFLTFALSSWWGINTTLHLI